MNEYELIEFFGVLPKVDEEDCYEYFQVERKGLRLEFYMFYSQAFNLVVTEKESSEIVFSTGFDGNFRIERQTNKNNYDCLILTVPFMSVGGEINWNYSFMVKVFIEPNIKVEILN